MLNKNRENWSEIDLLRGLAVIFMLVNHSILVFTNYDAEGDSVLHALFFIGSYAPVIFFFVTGVGYGVAHQVGKVAPLSSVFYKVLILLVADIFLRGALSNSFPTFGLDFLGFIGVSMLFLYLLRGRSYGVSLALILILVIFLLRFASPKIFGLFNYNIEDSYALSVFAAQEGYKISGFSYWIVPWLIYPLSGFLLGVLMKGRRNYINSSSFIPFSLLFVGVFIVLCSAYLLDQGMVIFRWGSVSFNFFISSIACLFLLLFVVCLFSRYSVFNRLNAVLSLRGVSSLAIVPIHYVFLHLYSYYQLDKLSSYLYLIAALLWIYCCIVLSNLVQTTSAKLSSYGYFMISWGCVFLLGCALLKVFFPVEPANFLLSFLAELALCFMLSFNFKKTKVSS